MEYPDVDVSSFALLINGLSFEFTVESREGEKAQAKQQKLLIGQSSFREVCSQNFQHYSL